MSSSPLSALPSLAAEDHPFVVARRDAYALARRAWAGVELSFDDFTSHLERVGWRDALPPHPEALYLTAACSVGVEAACVALERSYFSALEATLSNSRAQPDFTEEVLQRTRERLLVGAHPRIATYRGDGPLLAWLTVVTQRLALDMRRSDTQRRQLFRPGLRDYEAAVQASQPCDDDHECPLNPIWIARLEDTLRRAIASLDGPERQLLLAHYVEDRRAGDIGSALNVDRATVYRRLRRVEDKLGRYVRRDLRQSLSGMPAEALEEVLRASWTAINLHGQLLPVTSPAGVAKPTRTASVNLDAMRPGSFGRARQHEPRFAHAPGRGPITDPVSRPDRSTREHPSHPSAVGRLANVSSWPPTVSAALSPDVVARGMSHG